MADMTTAEKLSKVYEGVERTEELNAELEQTLYGTDTGGKSFYDEFWDAHQANGTRTNYANAFACWSADNIRPKYDMKPTTTYMMFRGAVNVVDGLLTLDLAERLNDCGVIIDTSKCTTFQYMFYESRIAHVGVLDTRGAASLNDIFDYSRIRTIDKLILRDDGSQTISGSFKSCVLLVDIEIEGVIGKNGLNFQWSTSLSKASITSIINALSTTTEGLTVTLSKTAKEAAFTADEWSALIATRTNWTISLV